MDEPAVTPKGGMIIYFDHDDLLYKTKVEERSARVQLEDILFKLLSTWTDFELV
jgi:hypothetical protein